MTVGLLSFASAPAASGLQINLTFDSSTSGAPAAYFTDAANAAAQIMAVGSTTPCTVNITCGYGFVAGVALPSSSSGSQIANSNFFSYAALLAALNANNRSASMAALIAQIPIGTSGPSGNPNGSNYGVCLAGQKILGLLGTTSLPDAYMGIGTSISSANFVNCFLHEFTECMGRVGGYGPNNLSRFTSTGVWNIAGTTYGAYFSLDGGTTNLANYTASSEDGGHADYADFSNIGGAQGSNDPFCTDFSGSTQQSLTSIDIELLNSMGIQ